MTGLCRDIQHLRPTGYEDATTTELESELSHPVRLMRFMREFSEEVEPIRTGIRKTPAFRGKNNVIEGVNCPIGYIYSSELGMHLVVNVSLIYNHDNAPVELPAEFKIDQKSFSILLL